MKFKHKIELFVNKTQSVMDQGDWQKTMELYADVAPLCDSRFVSLESMEFGNVIGEEYYIFHTRFVENISLEMRIKFNETIFEIKRIINKNFRNKFLSIIALEI